MRGSSVRVKPLFPARDVRRTALFLAATSFASFAAMYAAAAGTLGTATLGAWSATAVYAASFGLLVCGFLLRDRRSTWHLGVLAAALMLPALLAVGMSSQSLVAGRPVLATSELARTLDLVAEAEQDRAVLLSRQDLLSLPRAQARGVAAEYEAAARASLEIAARWNPATARDLPGQGFEEVYDLLNRAADAQSDALRAYILNVQAPQDALAEAAAGLSAEVVRLLSEESLGAAIRDARSGSIALLRQR